MSIATDNKLLSNISDIPGWIVAPLLHEGINTVGQLRCLTDEQLLRIPLFGKRALQRVREVTGPSVSLEDRVLKAETKISAMASIFRKIERNLDDLKRELAK